MSEYTELVERAEFAATSAKNSAAQTKSDKDTVVSLYNEIKAIIDAGGGGGGGSLTGKGFRLVASSPSGGGYITGGLNINIKTGTINNISLTGVGFVL